MFPCISRSATWAAVSVLARKFHFFFTIWRADLDCILSLCEIIIHSLFASFSGRLLSVQCFPSICVTCKCRTSHCLLLAIRSQFLIDFNWCHLETGNKIWVGGFAALLISISNSFSVFLAITLRKSDWLIERKQTVYVFRRAVAFEQLRLTPKSERSLQPLLTKQNDKL